MIILQLLAENFWQGEVSINLWRERGSEKPEME